MKHPTLQSRVFNELALYFQDLFRQEASARQQAVKRRDDESLKQEEKKNPLKTRTYLHTHNCD